MVQIENLTTDFCIVTETETETEKLFGTVFTYQDELMDLEWGSTGSSRSSTEEEVPEETFEPQNIPEQDIHHHNDSCHRSLSFKPWTFRHIQPGDRQRIQELHEEWFPVRYQDDFYDDLVLGKMCHTEEDLYTNVAVQGQENQVAACIVAAIVPAKRLNKVSRQLLLPDPQHHQNACYIMTLGTVTEYRKVGLATCLIEKCIQDLVLSDPSCGALYLHVITSNHAAIRFYERLGFWRVQEIPNYYTIDNQYHNCYLYAKYFHGNRGHLDVFQILTWWISSMWNKVKGPLAFLIKGSTPHRLVNSR